MGLLPYPTVEDGRYVFIVARNLVKNILYFILSFYYFKGTFLGKPLFDG